MMLSVTSAAAVALFASALSAAGAPAASTADIPPMIVTVVANADMSPAVVAAVLAEADAIWRPSGVWFSWRRAPRIAPSLPPGDSGPFTATTLRVIIGDDRGAGRDGRLPLGWIAFDGVATPAQEIYVSLANAKAMMDNARGVVGIVDQMPLVQRETLLARAMGRALAHELGHYLLASKVHTERGLMKAVLTAVELFAHDASTFRIEPAQRRIVAARLRGESMMASR
jgi:hypothetical protein